jgi:hypothetical protein
MEEFMNDKEQRKSSVEVTSGQEEQSSKPARAARARRSKNKRNRRKTGSYRPYPRVPLERALSVANAIKEKNGGNPWSAEQVAAAVGLSPRNVDFYYLLAASQKYGLTTGMKVDGEVTLTPLGREVVYSGSPDEELAAKRKAVLSIDVFAKVLHHYNGNRLPEMQYLGNTLQGKFDLPVEFHEEFSKLFKQTCNYVGWKEGLELDAAEPRQGDVAKRPSKEVLVLGEPRKKTGLTCFVIMPFKERTNEFMPGFFEEVLNSMIIPAVTDAGFEVKTASRQGTDIIHSTIISEVLNADMCVCDLSEHNPNVLFELGMRLANEKPVALVHAEGTQRVFDVDNILRVLPYKKQLWQTTVGQDLPELTAHIKATWENRDSQETYVSVLRKSPTKLQQVAAMTG